MVGTSAYWAVMGACVVVAVGCGGSEPAQSAPAASQAGAPVVGVAGAATPTSSASGGVAAGSAGRAGAAPSLPTAAMPPSAAGASASSPMAGTGSVTQPTAAGSKAGIPTSGAGSQLPPSAAGTGGMPQPSAAGMQAGGAGAGAAAQAEGRIPCDVATILFNRCRSCHGSPTNLGAPMSLVTWADLQKPAVTDPSRKVYELVAARVRDSMRPMPPAQDGKIAAADKMRVVDWCMQGAPSLPSGAAECPK